MSKWVSKYDAPMGHWVVFFEDFTTRVFITRNEEDAEFLTDRLNNSIKMKSVSGDVMTASEVKARHAESVQHFEVRRLELIERIIKIIDGATKNA